MLHFLNEIWIVQKTYLISQNGLKEKEGTVQGAQIAQSFFFIKILAGILYEAWRVIEQSYGTLDRQHSYNIPQASRDALADLKRHFSNSRNIVKYVRQKHSFHCDKDRVNEGIKSVSKQDDFEILLSQDGNYFCQLSETIINASILEFTKAESYKHALEIVYKDIVDVANWVTNFAHGFCDAIFARLGAKVRKETIPGIKKIKDLDVSYFAELD